MKVDKMSISLAPDVGEAVRDAAKREGVSLSAWLSDAAARKLRANAFREFIDEWEAEHGAITEEEMTRARRELSGS